MERRRYLLEIIRKLFKWVSYPFKYLYHSIIPSTVNKNKELPEEYQEVEYIESTGTQWINTGFASKNGMTYEAHFFNIAQTSSSGASLIGDDDWACTFYIRGSDQRYAISGKTGYALFGLTVLQTNDIRVKYQEPYSTSTVNGLVPNTLYPTQYSYGGNLKIFKGGTYSNVSARLDTCRVYDNNTLVRNFVPCYRKSDNVIGLFDTVNQVFYTNAGTGTFLKGNNVTRNVLDKTKIAKIEGNSEVENQLCVDYRSQSSYNGVTYSITNGVITISGTPTATAYIQPLNETLKVGHKYLVLVDSERTFTNTEMDLYVSGTYVYLTNKHTETIVNVTTAYQTNLNVRTGFDGVETKLIIRIVDITQRYPFDTPTSLTDPRVQNIIAQGNLDFNTGTIKNTVISEIAGEGFNIWDEEWELGSINGTTGQNESANNLIRSKNYINVLPNETYYFKAPSNFVYYFYDKDKNYLGGGDLRANQTFTIPSNAYYMRFRSLADYGTTYNHDICINVSSSLNGTYKEFNNFIELAYFKPIDVNGTHDIFKSLNNGNKISKCVSRVDIASLIWSYSSGNNRWESTSLQSTIKKPSSNNDVGNMKCSSLLVDSVNHAYSNPTIQSISVGTTGTLYVYGLDSSTSPTGTLDYELATYQVTSYPINHLGMVDLGSIGLSLSGGYWRALISNIKSPSASSMPNIYCDKYLNDTYAHLQSNGYIAVSDNGYIYIKDSTKTQASDFSGIYLYFETSNAISETGIVLDKGKIQLPAPLQIGGVGTAKNTFEVLKDNYRFTRNVFDYMFSGSESWSWSGTFWSFTSYLTNIPSSQTPLIANGIVATLYQNSGIFRVYPTDNPQITSSTNMNSVFPSGTVMNYRLSTPQVINIPKKHLGWVKLKDLSWNYENNKGFYSLNLANSKASGMCYCSKYMYGTTAWQVAKTIGINFQNTLWVGDTTYNNVPDFLASLTDNDILFFETQNETPDFLNEASCQAGGEINGQCARVPDAYQEVEYIESTGTQYVDTGVKEGDIYNFELDFENTAYIDEYPHKLNGILGTNLTSMPTKVWFGFDVANNTGRTSVLYHGSTSLATNYVPLSTYYTKHNIKVINATFYYDGENVGSLSTSGTASNNNIYLFSVNENGTSAYFSKTKLYLLKIYDSNNILIRNFIPVYRKSDSVIGLYDTVSGQFFTNQGTGTFLKGENVDSPICEVLPNVDMGLKCK